MATLLGMLALEKGLMKRCWLVGRPALKGCSS
jgi:hypothetical protein